MSEEHFVVLVSNCRDNDSSSIFTNNLPHPIKLYDVTGRQGHWVVGLAELTTCFSWDQINENQELTVYMKNGRTLNLSLPPGNYRQPHLMINALHNIFANVRTRRNLKTVDFKELKNKPSFGKAKEKTEHLNVQVSVGDLLPVSSNFENVQLPPFKKHEKVSTTDTIHEAFEITETPLVPNTYNDIHNVPQQLNENVFTDHLPPYFELSHPQLPEKSTFNDDSTSVHNMFSTVSTLYSPDDQYSLLSESYTPEKNSLSKTVTGNTREKYKTFSAPSPNTMRATRSHIHEQGVNEIKTPEDVYDKYGLRFYYNEAQLRIGIEIDNNVVDKIFISKELQYILGFESSVLFNNTLAKYMPDFNNNISSIYCYSDVVEPTIVGNVKSDILRVISLNDTKFGTTFSRQFAPIQYRPVRTNELNSITLRLLDEFAQPLKLNYGTTVATLHFKRVY